MAIGRVCGKWDRIITAITVIGTQRNMPGIPHREPHRPSDRRITRGLKFSELPSKRGSRKPPIIIWVAVMPPITAIIGNGLSNWIRARTDGKAVARIEPIVGI